MGTRWTTVSVLGLALVLGAGCSVRTFNFSPGTGGTQGAFTSEGQGGVPAVGGTGTGGAGIYCSTSGAAVGTGGHAFGIDIGVDGDTVAGAPRFVTRDVALGARREFVALADLSGDGHIDLVVDDADRSALVFFAGNGDGTFAPRETVLFPSGASSALLADVNGDQRVDVIVVPVSGSEVKVALNQGEGKFAPAISYPTLTEPPPRVSWRPMTATLADLTGDGFPDLAATGPPDESGQTGNVRVLSNDGRGAFAAPVSFGAARFPVRLLAGDLNGDGRVDLLSQGGCNANEALLNTGVAGPVLTPLSLSSVESETYMAFDRVAQGDLDGDGRADVVMSDYAGWRVKVFLNKGPGFAAAVPYTVTDPLIPAVGDINGDGHPDLVVASGTYAGRGLSILLGNGDGSFGRTLRYGASLSANRVALGDVNGDGKLDVVITRWDGLAVPGVSVLVNATP